MSPVRVSLSPASITANITLVFCFTFSGGQIWKHRLGLQSAENITTQGLWEIELMIPPRVMCPTCLFSVYLFMLQSLHWKGTLRFSSEWFNFNVCGILIIKRFSQKMLPILNTLLFYSLEMSLWHIQEWLTVGFSHTPTQSVHLICSAPTHSTILNKIHYTLLNNFINIYLFPCCSTEICVTFQDLI